MSNDRMESVRADQIAFDEQLEKLLAEHAGEFVVFRSGAPVGFFPGYGSAYEFALAEFGTEGVFLVSEVKRHAPEPVSVSWDLGLVVGEA